MPETMPHWLHFLNEKLSPGFIEKSQHAGRGFFYLTANSPETLKQLHMLTPLRSMWGTCIFQTWKAGFNPDKPNGLKIPTWIALRKFPPTLAGLEEAVASKVGTLIGGNVNNNNASDPRFCVAMDAGHG